MLTKEDHIKIIKIFNDRPASLFNERCKGKAEMKVCLAGDFREWLKEDNPDFDENNFIESIRMF